MFHILSVLFVGIILVQSYLCQGNILSVFFDLYLYGLFCDDFISKFLQNKSRTDENGGFSVYNWRFTIDDLLRQTDAGYSRLRVEIGCQRGFILTSGRRK